MSDSPAAPEANQPPTSELLPAEQRGLYATGCLSVAGTLMCMTVILAPIGVVLISIAGMMFGVNIVRRKFFNKATAACPYCLVTVTFRGEGIKPCPDCCHPVAVVLGRLYNPEEIP